jgi:hypothetical protein
MIFKKICPVGSAFQAYIPFPIKRGEKTTENTAYKLNEVQNCKCKGCPPFQAIKTFWIDSETVSIPNSLSFSLRYASLFNWVAVIMGISKEAEMIVCLTMLTGIVSILAKRMIKTDVIWEISVQCYGQPLTKTI